jgi:hypothetical protein
MFLYCPRLSDLLTSVRQLLAGILSVDSITTDIYVLGPWAGRQSHSTWPKQLGSWVATQSKLATYVTRQNLMSGDGPTNAHNNFVSRLRARISVEFDFHKLQNSVESFCDMWCLNEALCSVSQGELYLHV